MSLRTNATMVFTDYNVEDSGLTLHFVCPNPGGGEPSDYYVTLADTELSTVTNATSFKTLVDTKLKRKYRAANIASKLDSLIGQSTVI